MQLIAQVFTAAHRRATDQQSERRAQRQMRTGTVLNVSTRMA